MQGRLLPKYQGRYQAHPLGCWQQEFNKAAQLGLDCIEFILDLEGAESNPLLRSEGVEEILKLTELTGIRVHTVCADYFMVAPLHSVDGELAEQGQDVLRRLLRSGIHLGLTDIVIPCVDQSSLTDGSARRRLVNRLSSVVDDAESAGINLALETDLPPQQFAELLASFGSCRVTANYDIGNSAALGFDPLEELGCYGDRISDIHIKDRSLGGGSVILGTGNAQFTRFFSAVSALDYTGPYILQAYRDDEGARVFERQLAWVRERFPVLFTRKVSP